MLSPLRVEEDHGYGSRRDDPNCLYGESVMKHYGLSQWVDFARGLVPEEIGLSMRGHLAEGCSECRDMAEFCAKLYDVSEQAASHAAPDWVVRNAKAIFPVHAQPPRKRAIRIAVEL